ncbi:hypothetical protein KC327_g18805, partial [Hortaea werneckii]
EGQGQGHAGPQWWEMQDLFVDRTNGELLSTKESYIMVWEGGEFGLVGPDNEEGKGRRKRKRESGGDGVGEHDEKGEHRLTEAYLEDGSEGFVVR